MKRILTSLALACLCSCTTPYRTNDPLTSVYDKQGQELAKVSEKNLASVRQDGTVPLVKLTKDEDWQDWGYKILDSAGAIGKGVVEASLANWADELRVRATK